MNTDYGAYGQSQPPPYPAPPVGAVSHAVSPGYPTPQAGMDPGYPVQSQAHTVDFADDETHAISDLGFSEKSIRLGFVKKVFAILSLQLLITAGILCMFLFWEDLKNYSQANSWMYIAALCVYIGLVLVLGCVNDIRRRFPINLILLILITLALSWMLGSFASYFDAEEVLMAVGIVFAITVVMAILGVQQKFDFTWMVGLLVILTVSMMGFALLCAIFRSNYLYMFYAVLGAILFSLWLLVDIQMIMGGKRKYTIDPEEYIFAALNIYVDIVQLLFYVLMIIAAAKN